MTIALVTDFGTTDIYSGVMKAVMLGIHPQAQFIDLTHGIEPQNVRQAAFALMNAFQYFPAGTVFLVVVDPGVGSRRRPVAIMAGEYAFVAPDNGVVSYALSQLPEARAVEIAVPETQRTVISRTFHGRDVFAPAAARLALGHALETLGEPVDQLFRLPMPQLIVDGTAVLGEVVHVDRFGNLVTSIGSLRWSAAERLTLTPAFGGISGTVPISAENAQITINDQTITGIRHTYSEAERGGLLALVGSTNYLEISVNQGSAAQRVDAAPGDRVELSAGTM